MKIPPLQNDHDHPCGITIILPLPSSNVRATKWVKSPSFLRLVCRTHPIMLSGVLNVGKLEAVLTELSNKVVRLSTDLRGRLPHLTILLRSLN